MQSTQDKMRTRGWRVSDSLAKKLKVLAAKNETSIEEELEKAIKKHVGRDD